MRESDIQFIYDLKKLPGAVSYDGDASIQVAFLLTNGKTLRIGLTDDDVGTGELWADNYAGLPIVGAEGGDLLHGLRLKHGTLSGQPRQLLRAIWRRFRRPPTGP